MTWLASVHCALRGHRWQSLDGNCEVCLRCGINGWIISWSMYPPGEERDADD